MNTKQSIENLLGEIVTKFGGTETVILTSPSDTTRGDYTSNIAMVLGKKLGKNPMELAEEIVQQFRMQSLEFRIIEKVDVVAPGFINFWLHKEVLLESLQGLALQTSLWKDRKVIVEYSSPNIAKPFTVGHLRSTIIGDAVSNLLEATGATVYRDNHVGDWGTQFGKQICAIKKWGSIEEIEASERPVKVLVELYVMFHEEAEKTPELNDEARGWFKKLEEGDTEARNLWQKCIDWSWKEFDEIYKTLGVTFTENNGRGYGEAFFEDKMGPVIEELMQKKLLTESEGAKLVFFPDDELPPLMIVKKDGATLYATRDLATDKFRKENYGSGVTIINEVGAEQSLQFQQLYKVEELLGWFEKGQRIHIKHGMFRFKEGKMSTRKGNVIWLEDVLEEARMRVGKLGEMAPDVINQIAVGAIKWNDLRRGAAQDILFDWDDLLNLQGNSGPYIQYSFVRTQSVLSKSRISNDKYQMPNNTNWIFDIGNLKFEIEEMLLLRTLYRFSDVVAQAAENYSPSTLCTYLFELAQTFNSFYQACPILNQAEEVTTFRLALTKSTGETLQKGLNLLGIQTPEKM